MRLRTIKRRHDARTVRIAKLRASYQCLDWQWEESEWPDDEPCHHCGGDTMDPDCDYLMPCPVCGGGA